jgi:antitoxin CptB
VSDTKTAFSAEGIKRLYWHSRRGMLELDLLLVPFAECCLASLGDDELQMYRELLAEEDQDLFMWLTRRSLAPTPRLQQIIDRILQASAQERASR